MKASNQTGEGLSLVGRGLESPTPEEMPGLPPPADGPRPTGRRRRSDRPGSGKPGKRAPPAPSSLIELKVRAPPPTHWLQDLGSRWGAVVQVHVCRPLGKHPGLLLRLLEVVAEPDKIPEISRFLYQNAGRGSVALTRLAPHRLLVRLVAPTPALCTTVFDLGAICTSCPFLPLAPGGPKEEGEFVWGLLTPSAAGMAPLLESYRTPGSPPPKLLRVGMFRASRELTSRQEMAIDMAVRLGYFETPRRAGLPEVAKALGVSRATAMELLRRGLQKLTEQRKSGAPLPLAPP